MNMQAVEPGTAASSANTETEALAQGGFTQDEIASLETQTVVSERGK